MINCLQLTLELELAITSYALCDDLRLVNVLTIAILNPHVRVTRRNERHLNHHTTIYQRWNSHYVSTRPHRALYVQILESV
jgi:hypothetical protein